MIKANRIQARDIQEGKKIKRGISVEGTSFAPLSSPLQEVIEQKEGKFDLESIEGESLSENSERDFPHASDSEIQECLGKGSMTPKELRRSGCQIEKHLAKVFDAQFGKGAYKKLSIEVRAKMLRAYFESTSRKLNPGLFQRRLLEAQQASSAEDDLLLTQIGRKGDVWTGTLKTKEGELAGKIEVRGSEQDFTRQVNAEKIRYVLEKALKKRGKFSSRKLTKTVANTLADQIQNTGSSLSGASTVGNLDAVQGVGAICSAIQLNEARRLFNEAEEMLAQAKVKESEGESSEARMLRKGAKKLMRQAVGITIPASSYGIASVLSLSTMVLSTSQVIATTSALATALPIAGGALSIVGGTAASCANIRNLSRVNKKRKALSEIEKEALGLRATGEMDRDTKELIDDFISYHRYLQSIKFVDNSWGLAINATTITAGCIGIAVAAGATEGIALVPIVVGFAALYGARYAHLKHKKSKYKKEQKILAETDPLRSEKGMHFRLYEAVLAEELGGPVSDLLIEGYLGVPRELFLQLVQETMEDAHD